MLEYLPKEIRSELAQAQNARKRKRSKRSVHVGDEAYTLLEMTDRGFAVEADGPPALRGLIDIFEGSRHLYQALIVASDQDGDVTRYEFKRNTATQNHPPVDFVLDQPNVLARLPR